METYTYTDLDLFHSFQEVGVQYGDAVLIQLSPGMLGWPKGVEKAEDIYGLIIKALRDVVGSDGTILVPVYTLSFCKRMLFDVKNTKSDIIMGNFPDYFLKLPGVIRSADPNFSVAGIGPLSEKLLTKLPHTHFGEGCLYDRFTEINGKYIALGLGLHNLTPRHYYEEIAKVPFRFKKTFTGYVKDGNQIEKQRWIYNVRILADNGLPVAVRMAKELMEEKIGRKASIGRSEVYCIESTKWEKFLLQRFMHDPWFTANGPAGDPVELEKERVKGRKFKVSVATNASMKEIIDALWKLPRDVVSDGFDKALHLLKTLLPMVIHEYPSGTQYGEWIIPEKWTCHEACLETTDGEPLFSYADNPLHVVSYSLPFEGEVTQEELFNHLHVHPAIPDAVPFKSQYEDRDWGLCCSKTLKDGLTQDRYKVTIKSSFSYSTLKVGEVVVTGERKENIIFCCHLCHPSQVNDGLTGIAVAVDVMRYLLKCSTLKYTYRLLIVPELIGSVAWLDQNQGVIHNIKAWFFLDMLGLDLPLIIGQAYKSDSEIDLCLKKALSDTNLKGSFIPYRYETSEDTGIFDRFDTLGASFPLLSLSRINYDEMDTSPPFYAYHSSKDDVGSINENSLAESRDLMVDMINYIENN